MRIAIVTLILLVMGAIRPTLVYACTQPTPSAMGWEYDQQQMIKNQPAIVVGTVVNGHLNDNGSVAVAGIQVEEYLKGNGEAYVETELLYCSGNTHIGDRYIFFMNMPHYPVFVIWDATNDNIEKIVEITNERNQPVSVPIPSTMQTPIPPYLMPDSANSDYYGFYIGMIISASFGECAVVVYVRKRRRRKSKAKRG